ncbi:tripartite tricarboxylate transporter substrate binding protein [Ramlibacter sp. RBP-2]|uniref:Tripartite tricarboxylate transporter substrate binding protein n=1 Tax=Ramlibacter lithotrophicus TaxID=2606681 RepID=A0A7X6I8M6_9BURK|nr:tripartite tricarboxylate transporter substrate binding protein [Ramlibacter lithotrophicus]NKE68588.1 tripartite tricarboxylate transporter substrate binding protein [Ramlibacter lithotrophicus]
MTPNRRQVLTGAAALALGGMAPLVRAQAGAEWPNGPVKIVVGFSAGGPTDLAARLIAARLQAAFGQSFVVENKAGAGSNLASEIVAAAAPDGHTLLMAAAPIAINGHLYRNLKFDVLKSFDPVSQVMSAPCILAVRPDSYKTMAELLAAAKKEPGRLSYSSSGAGGSQHLAGELLQQKAGIQLIHVPYKGAAPALNDLLGGQVAMGFMTSLSSVPHFKSGKLRALAVAAPQRLPQLPDVPTMAEVGLPGVEINSWSGLLAPAKTPPQVVEKLQREVAKALAAPDVREKLVAQGAVVVGGTSGEFASYLAREHGEYGKLIKSIKLSLD